jgi:hypothetical protein
MARKNAPPTAAALKHARRRTHRDPRSGQFLTPIEKRAGKGGLKDPAIGSKPLAEPSLDQDAGGGFNPNDDAIQQ